VGKRMSEDELQKVIAFCGGVFLPVDPELHAHVAPRLDSKLLDPHGPVVTPEEIDLLVPDDLEAQLVLKEINGRKGVTSTFSTVGSFSDEVTVGFSARLTRGNVGLISHEPKAMPTAVLLE
jgi:flavine halogenase